MSRVLPEDTAKSLIRRFAMEGDRSDRAERLRMKVRETAASIARELGARKVYLFGSLVWGGIHSRTDVDLAVEGLSSAQVDHFSAGVIQTLGVIPDVVRIEEAPENLRRRIEESAEILWEDQEKGT
jgi:predicted nucleotidyltransferase